MLDFFTGMDFKFFDQVAEFRAAHDRGMVDVLDGRRILQLKVLVQQLNE
jgi:hypothetical protein